MFGVEYINRHNAHRVRTTHHRTFATVAGEWENPRDRKRFSRR